MTLPAACFNCSKPRPSVAPSAQSFRCFHCGAVNAAAAAPPVQEPRAAAPKAVVVQHVEAIELAPRAGAPGPVAVQHVDAIEPAPRVHAVELEAPLALAFERRPGERLRPPAPPAPPAPPPPAKAGGQRQLAPYQQETVEGRVQTWTRLALVALAVLAPCGYVAWTLWGLRELNDPQLLVAMALAPLFALVSSLSLGLSRIGAARQHLENQLSAMRPTHVSSPHCYTCGGPLRAWSFLERCPACGCDNITAEHVVRRAKKTQAVQGLDGDRVTVAEIAHRHGVLVRAITMASASVLILPALVLGFDWLVWRQRDWKVPPDEDLAYAVVTTPNCFRVVVPESGIVDGLVEVPRPSRGTWQAGAVPVAINRILHARDFVGMKGRSPGMRVAATIKAVYRLTTGSDTLATIDHGRPDADIPLTDLCMSVDQPYRNARGRTEAQEQAWQAQQREADAERAAERAEARRSAERGLVQAPAPRQAPPAPPRSRSTEIRVYAPPSTPSSEGPR